MGALLGTYSLDAGGISQRIVSVLKIEFEFAEDDAREVWNQYGELQLLVKKEKLGSKKHKSGANILLDLIEQ